MASSQAQLLFSFLIILSCIHRATTSVINCRVKCRENEPVVRFPFRLIHQPYSCGYPGFNVLCNKTTAIQLPYSGQFTILNINYVAQTLTINDPDTCLPRRFLDQSFSLAGSPFEQDPVEFTFLNCSSDGIPAVGGLRIVDCLSGANFTVVAIPNFKSNESEPSSSSCSEIKTVSVPVLWPVWSNLVGGVTLKWNVPDCASCEERGGFCGFKKDISRDMELGCANLPGSPGLPRSAKYGIIIGVGIPGLLCIIGLGCYLCGKFRACYEPHDGDGDGDIGFGTSITPQPAVILTGLDKPTIESYPKTVLGDSGRLPKPNDSTCPICLCEYQPKETLRTIPQCNHFFHAVCIDEWLKISASCPLCRNSRESSTVITPSSSASSSSSSSSSSIMEEP